MHGYAALARKLMNEHGLHGWKIEWSRAKKTHGLCNHKTRTLTFSRVAFDLIGEAEVIDTILHEIAHALNGISEYPHGAAWFRIYRRIGGTGGEYVSEAASAAVQATAAWQGKCSRGHTTAQHRAPLRVNACVKCSKRWSMANVWQWSHNGRAMHPLAISTRYADEWRRLTR